jgi:hypothetical protein
MAGLGTDATDSEAERQQALGVLLETGVCHSWYLACAVACNISGKNPSAVCFKPVCRNKPNLLSFNCRVSFVGVGFIKLDRQLPYNVSTRWAPGLHIFERE